MKGFKKLEMKNRTLLYLITAKGLGDIIVRLPAIKILLPHYNRILIIGPKFIYDLLSSKEKNSNLFIIPLTEFNKSSSTSIRYADTIIYSSRDHSFLGLIKYTFMLLRLKVYNISHLQIPNIYYLLGFFQRLTSRITKTQNEFYLHQALETLSIDYSLNSFLVSLNPNALTIIKRINNLYKRINNSPKSIYKEEGPIKNIMIFPSGKMKETIWPYYNDLIVKLLKTDRYKINIVAAKEEEVSIYKKFLKNKNLIITHSIGLEDLNRLIDSADLIVSNDSGPKHLSTLSETKILAIEGYISDWSAVTYSKNCFSIFQGGYGASTSFSPKLRKKSLMGININYVFSSIEIICSFNHE